MNPLYIFGAFLLVVLIAGGGIPPMPAMIWLVDSPGTISAGNPDTIYFPQYPARTFELDEWDNIKVYGSAYAFGTAEACERVGGNVKSNGVCLLTGAIPNIDYVIDNLGNRYDDIIQYGADFEIVGNYGYIPTSMTWYMKTSASQEPNEPDIPEPDPPEPTNLLQMIINAISSWISSIISWLLPSATIAGAETIQLGQSITANVELSVPAPDSSYADGTTSMHYGVAFVSDSNGNVVWNTEQTVVTGTSYTSTVSYTPTTHGSYVIGAIVAETTANFNLNTGTWEPWTDPVIIAEDTLVVTVTGAPVPPPPPSFNLLSLIQSLIDWIKSLFGVS